jgi:hypothetical protein
MKWLGLLAIFAASPALADAPKDTVVSGAVLHGDVKMPRDEKARQAPVKDEPSASKQYRLISLPVAKDK